LVFVYYKGFTRQGVVAGWVVGLIAVTLTDETPAWFGVSWGACPLKIHSAGWGILFNLATTMLVFRFTTDSEDTMRIKDEKHRFLQTVSGMNLERRKKVNLAWVLTFIWFLVGFGPFVTIGNSLFPDPNTPTLWVPFGMPSLWLWQLFFLGYGVFVMWLLAFHMGMSEPIDLQRIEEIFEEIERK